jgi:hypothetical protein
MGSSKHSNKESSNGGSHRSSKESSRKSSHSRHSSPRRDRSGRASPAPAPYGSGSRDSKYDNYDALYPHASSSSSRRVEPLGGSNDTDMQLREKPGMAGNIAVAGRESRREELGKARDSFEQGGAGYEPRGTYQPGMGLIFPSSNESETPPPPNSWRTSNPPSYPPSYPSGSNRSGSNLSWTRTPEGYERRPASGSGGAPSRYSPPSGPSREGERFPDFDRPSEDIYGVEEDYRSQGGSGGSNSRSGSGGSNSGNGGSNSGREYRARYRY